MTTRLILDTDIGTDVDDALALAFAVRHPEIELVAVTTVADDVTKRAHIAHELLRIAGRTDVEVAPGVGWSEPPSGRRSWLGHEGKGLLDRESPPTFDRDGVALLLDETRSGDVEVAAVGMQSNVAAAVGRDETFAARLARLDVMGGVFAPIRVGAGELPPSSDHNLMADAAASVRALNAGARTLYVPLNVTVQAPLFTAHVDRLRDGDELCRALARLIDVWIGVAKFPDGLAAVLHDPLTVACAVDLSFVSTETMPVTVAIHEGLPRTFVDPVAGHQAEVVTSVDGLAFADFWLETVLGG